MWEAHALLAGHSARKDLARLVEFDAAIRAGDFFPAWSPDLYSGYGSPIFQFYAPLAYYVTEVPVLMGFDYATALKLTQLLALFFSGLAMYRLACTDFSGWVACLGGIFYMVAPYRLVDMFVRHALAEHCAFIWLPLIVWGTERFVSKSSRIGLVTGALATAALIFTHNVMALIGLPVCVVAGWAFASPALTMVASPFARGRVRVDSSGSRAPGNSNPSSQSSPLAKGERRSKHSGAETQRTLLILSLASAGAVAVLGIGMEAFFWWPAMAGRALTQAEPSLTGGYYDFHHHFIEGWQFLNTHWSFGISGGGPGNNPESLRGQMPVQIGLPHLFVGLGALAIVLGRWQGKGSAGRRRARWSVLGLCVMAVGVFMCCRWSQLLWESLPLVRYAQFPWRFLGLVVFGSAMCVTAVADRFAATSERAGIITLLVGLAVVMAAYFPYYSQANFLVGDARTRSLKRVSTPELDALQSAGALIPFGFWTPTPAELQQMREQATSSDDFLPRAVKEKPTQPPTEMVHTEMGRVVESARLHHNHYRARLQMFAPGKAQLLQFWFPGWQATVDGLPSGTDPTGPQAIVSCDVPAGDHVVEFSYRGLPQRRIGVIVSILFAALGACALWFLRPRIKGARSG